MRGRPVAHAAVRDHADTRVRGTSGAAFERVHRPFALLRPCDGVGVWLLSCCCSLVVLLFWFGFAPCVRLPRATLRWRAIHVLSSNAAVQRPTSLRLVNAMSFGNGGFVKVMGCAVVVLSGQNWTDFYYFTMSLTTSAGGSLFIILYFAFSNFVLMSLFVSVILENFEIKQTETEREQAEAYDRLAALVQGTNRAVACPCACRPPTGVVDNPPQHTHPLNPFSPPLSPPLSLSWCHFPFHSHSCAYFVFFSQSIKSRRPALRVAP